MSVSDSSWLFRDANDAEARDSRPRTWWARFSTRCAGPACPRNDRLWPSWLQKSEGIAFEGRWYCSRGCLETILGGRVHALLSGFQQDRPRAHRVPLGLLLLRSGAISHAQLREAIRLQRAAGQRRLGDWLQQIADLSAQQLTAALAQQWGCPVFPLDNQAVPASWCDLIPLPVLESAAAVPAHAAADARTLHIAFSDHVDHTLLYAVEQMLSCRTFACAAPEPAVHAQLDQFRRAASGSETVFDTVRESPEMTWTICNYAAELNAASLTVARAGSFVWVRFFRDRSARDLLFRVLGSSPTVSRERSWAAMAKANGRPADERKDGVSNAALPV